MTTKRYLVYQLKVRISLTLLRSAVKTLSVELMTKYQNVDVAHTVLADFIISENLQKL